MPGIGRTQPFVPVDAVTRITANQVWIGQRGAHIVGAPAYDPDLAPPDRPYFGGRSDYSGFVQYWDGGHQLPGYPYSYDEHAD